MAEDRSEIERLREAARQARQEAVRVREHARELERRLREEAREQKRRLRAERREQRRERREAEREKRAPSGAGITEVLDLSGVRQISLHQSAGQLTVLACDSGEEPAVTTGADRATPKLTVDRQGDTLLMDIKLPTGWLFRRRRGATTTLRLKPGPESLVFDLGAGDIQLRAAQAREIKVSTGAGVIGSVASTGALEARAGAGKVSIYSHHGEVRCNTGTGDALVDIAETTAGTYRIDVGIGRADLRFPPGAEVHTAVRSGIGRGRLEYPDSGPGAPIQATVNAGIGEATIRRREGAAEQRPGGGGPERPRATRKAAAGKDSREAEELRILQLLEQGRLTVAEAGELIAALHGTPPSGPETDVGEEEDPEPSQ